MERHAPYYVLAIDIVLSQDSQRTLMPVRRVARRQK